MAHGRPANPEGKRPGQELANLTGIQPGSLEEAQGFTEVTPAFLAHQVLQALAPFVAERGLGDPNDFGCVEGLGVGVDAGAADQGPGVGREGVGEVALRGEESREPEAREKTSGSDLWGHGSEFDGRKGAATVVIGEYTKTAKEKRSPNGSTGVLAWWSAVRSCLASVDAA